MPANGRGRGAAAPRQSRSYLASPDAGPRHPRSVPRPLDRDAVAGLPARSAARSRASCPLPSRVHPAPSRVFAAGLHAGAGHLHDARRVAGAHEVATRASGSTSDVVCSSRVNEPLRGAARAGRGNRRGWGVIAKARSPPTARRAAGNAPRCGPGPRKRGRPTTTLRSRVARARQRDHTPYEPLHRSDASSQDARRRGLRVRRDRKHLRARERISRGPSGLRRKNGSSGCHDR